MQILVPDHGAANSTAVYRRVLLIDQGDLLKREVGRIPSSVEREHFRAAVRDAWTDAELVIFRSNAGGRVVSLTLKDVRGHLWGVSQKWAE